MKTITTNNHTLLLVEIEKDSKNFDIYEFADMIYLNYYEPSKETIDWHYQTNFVISHNVNDKFELIGNTSTLTNEQVEPFVKGRRRELGKVVDGEHNEWDNYNKKYMFSSISSEAFCKTPLDSFFSMLQANNIDLSKEYVILQIKND